jgi:hypothetical protein
MHTQSVFFLSALLVLVYLMSVPSFSTEPAQNLGYRGSGRLGTEEDYRGSGRVTVWGLTTPI